MTARVHLADRPPAPSGRARARCGLWSASFTTDRAAATCLRCLACIEPVSQPVATNVTGEKDPTTEQ